MKTIERRFIDAVDQMPVTEVDLVARVLDQIEGQVPGEAEAVSIARRRRPAGRPLAVALAMVVVIAGVGVVTVAPARRAVADWLGIGATVVERSPVDRSESVDDGVQVDSDIDAGDLEGGEPSAESLGQPIDPAPDGSRPLDPIPPQGLPDQIIDDPGRGRSYVWGPGPDLPPLAETEVGLVLSVRLVAEAGLAIKSVVGDVGVDLVTVDGPSGPIAGLWISGTHDLIAAGRDRPVVAERVLLWEAAGIEYRLESALPLPEMLELAASVETSTEDGTSLLPPG